jgi:hypothetical protein
MTQEITIIKKIGGDVFRKRLFARPKRRCEYNLK